MTSPDKSWNTHYTRGKSALHYPDENLVRMIKPWTDARGDASLLACLDVGCGSGRHIALAHDLGYGLCVGSDIAFNGLLIAQEFNAPLICADSCALPFKDHSFDAIIAWGSLHYGRKNTLPLMISELKRILKPKGALFGTLRSSRDTMMRTGVDLGNNEWQTTLTDIDGSIVSFYNEDELVKAFAPFATFTYGIAERSPIGSLSNIISHWYYRADA